MSIESVPSALYPRSANHVGRVPPLSREAAELLAFQLGGMHRTASGLVRQLETTARAWGVELPGVAASSSPPLDPDLDPPLGRRPSQPAPDGASLVLVEMARNFDLEAAPTGDRLLDCGEDLRSVHRSGTVGNDDEDGDEDRSC